jgi:hypothetical protein
MDVGENSELLVGDYGIFLFPNEPSTISAVSRITPYNDYTKIPVQIHLRRVNFQYCLYSSSWPGVKIYAMSSTSCKSSFHTCRTGGV